MTENLKQRLSKAAGIGLIGLASMGSLGGCGMGHGGKMSLGSYATNTPGTPWTNDIGEAITYTRDLGHVDLTHTWLSVDYTKRAFNGVHDSLMEGKEKYVFGLFVEPTDHITEFKYPDNWNSLKRNEKQEIARDIAISLGPYIAQKSTVWHESASYHGFKCMAFIPEQPSAFSWEDSISDALGNYVAREAIESGGDFKKETKRILRRILAETGQQSVEFAKRASSKMRGEWWSGTFMVDMKLRHMDTGRDGSVTPILVPGMFPNARPRSIPVVTRGEIDEKLDKYGFGADVFTSPKIFEAGAMMKHISDPIPGKEKLVHVHRHYPQILAGIRRHALKKGWKVSGYEGKIDN
jgi:hypothetical protein